MGLFYHQFIQNIVIVGVLVWQSTDVDDSQNLPNFPHFQELLLYGIQYMGILFYISCIIMADIRRSCACNICNICKAK